MVTPRPDHNAFVFNSNVQNAYKHILLKERKGMSEEGGREAERARGGGWGGGERGNENKLSIEVGVC